MPLPKLANAAAPILSKGMSRLLTRAGTGAAIGAGAGLVTDKPILESAALGAGAGAAYHGAKPAISNMMKRMSTAAPAAAAAAPAAAPAAAARAARRRAAAAAAPAAAAPAAAAPAAAAPAAAAAAPAAKAPRTRAPKKTATAAWIEESAVSDTLARFGLVAR